MLMIMLLDVECVPVALFFLFTFVVICLLYFIATVYGE